MAPDGARSLLIHLRLPFQLLLAPVFLWGWLVAGGGLNALIVTPFIAYHVFLYGGATAFNSSYDRDVGPVGGLERPPPVVPALLPFSLIWQALGAVLAATVNAWFLATYIVFVMLSVAYSHPAIRLKGRPLASLLTVGFGQGALAFAGAWAAARGDLSGFWSPAGVLGALAATLLILALYPLTQLYQIDEDRARGDRTIAVAWGAPRCFAFAIVCQLLGGAAMISVLAATRGMWDALLVGAGLIVQTILLAWWATHFDAHSVLGTYRHVMRLNTISAGALGAYLLVRLTISV